MVMLGDGLLLMGILLFFFCGACVSFFGGTLYEGKPMLEGTESAENYWYALNFNDFSYWATFEAPMGSSMVLVPTLRKF